VEENLKIGEAYEKMYWYSLIILVEPGCVFPQVKKCGQSRQRQRRSKVKKQRKMHEVENLRY
jgi:hypothetical protein